MASVSEDANGALNGENADNTRTPPPEKQQNLSTPNSPASTATKSAQIEGVKNVIQPPDDNTKQFSAQDSSGGAVDEATTDGEVENSVESAKYGISNDPEHFTEIGDKTESLDDKANDNTTEIESTSTERTAENNPSGENAEEHVPDTVKAPKKSIKGSVKISDNDGTELSEGTKITDVQEKEQKVPLSDDQPKDERPVRQKLKETSIAGAARTSSPNDQITTSEQQNQVTEEDNPSDAGSVDDRGRLRKKRSHDDMKHDEVDAAADKDEESGHRRKRSRDSKPEDNVDTKERPEGKPDDNDSHPPIDSAEVKAAEDEASTKKADLHAPPQLPAEQSKSATGDATRITSSPKKKRSRDQFDNDDVVSDEISEKKDIVTDAKKLVDGPKGPSIVGRTHDGEPEKKRHRDNSQDRRISENKGSSSPAKVMLDDVPFLTHQKINTLEPRKTYQIHSQTHPRYRRSHHSPKPNHPSRQSRITIRPVNPRLPHLPSLLPPWQRSLHRHSHHLQISEALLLHPHSIQVPHPGVLRQNKRVAHHPVLSLLLLLLRPLECQLLAHLEADFLVLPLKLAEG